MNRTGKRKGTFARLDRAIRLFWLRVRVDDKCWVWIGANTNGYGKLLFQGEIVYAHRLAYEWVNGPIPEGMAILHRCDNPSCVRPGHLFVGTQADNMRDMFLKGRARIGPGFSHAPWNRVVTLEMASAILARYEEIKVKAQVAREFDLGVTTIGRIVSGEHPVMEGRLRRG